MKLLHASDLHFNKEWFEWIAKQQEKYDIFSLTGDFLEPSKEESLAEQIEWVSRWMERFRKPLFICSGNHDIEEPTNKEWFTHIPNVYADNTIKRIGGITFCCVSYSTPQFHRFQKCDILLYHLPPAHTKTSFHKKRQEECGDEAFYSELKNGTITPSIVLCGHVHRPRDTMDTIKQTTIYNPGVDKKSKVPKHNVIALNKL